MDFYYFTYLMFKSDDLSRCFIYFSTVKHSIFRVLYFKAIVELYLFISIYTLQFQGERQFAGAYVCVIQSRSQIEHEINVEKVLKVGGSKLLWQQNRFEDNSRMFGDVEAELSSLLTHINLLYSWRSLHLKVAN